MLFRKRPFWVEKVLYGFHSLLSIAIRIFQKLRGGQRKGLVPEAQRGPKKKVLHRCISFQLALLFLACCSSPGLSTFGCWNHLISISIDCRLPSWIELFCSKNNDVGQNLDDHRRMKEGIILICVCWCLFANYNYKKCRFVQLVKVKFNQSCPNKKNSWVNQGWEWDYGSFFVQKSSVPCRKGHVCHITEGLVS